MFAQKERREGRRENYKGNCKTFYVTHKRNKETNFTFYTPNNVFLQNNMLRRKNITCMMFNNFSFNHLKVQSCKLYNDKYMIASTQITNTEIFVFIAVLVFKVLSRKVLFRNRKDNRKCLKSWILFKKIVDFTGKLLQNDSWNVKVSVFYFLFFFWSM